MYAKAVTESMDGELTAVTNIANILAELLDISVLVDQNSMRQAPVIIFYVTYAVHISIIPTMPPSVLRNRMEVQVLYG